MNTERATGVLCHISSLPSKYGIGNLGKEAYQFAKLLAKNKVKYWQILPLVQTGFGDSPYQSVSCNSGNPYFIDLEGLYKQKLITKQELKGAQMRDLDFGALYESRYTLLRTAFSRFSLDDESFRAFVKSGKVEDYALFMTAKTVFGGSFNDWEKAIRFHDADALETLRTKYHEEYLFWQFTQYCFFTQWFALKEYANGLGVQIIGDIPLYVAYDSADVWAHSELFALDKDLKLKKVAGVPPDYFSETGQLWGNPVYDWKANEKDEFKWWKWRLDDALNTYDVIRIDHFRGFDRYYQVDAEAENAIHGEWKDGPKRKLFEGYSSKRIIAEDLGVCDDGVKKLLEDTGFSGMKVLLFAFDGNTENPFLPHNVQENSVIYSGTHDNDTVVGYVKTLSDTEFILFRSRVAQELSEIGISVTLSDKAESYPKVFMKMALCSKSRLCIIPIQDILGLDNSARMNLPGSSEGNWSFRLKRIPSARRFCGLKKDIKKYRR